MKVQECYTKMGGNYDDVISRLRKESFVEKFLVRFPEDPSYNELVEGMENEDVELAFRAAHTLKGVCQNLALERLFVPVNEMTETLRAKDLEGAKPMLPQVTEIYNSTLEAINEFIKDQE
ncbi:MAG: Hpt domain-containing protein [Lachnospiraceae bacterium]|nr:Hpt domain-containing protein [Lachnospiraceae bacterium]